MAGIGAHSVAIPVDFWRPAGFAGQRILKSALFTRKRSLDKTAPGPIPERRFPTIIRGKMTIVAPKFGPKFGVGAAMHVEMQAIPVSIQTSNRDA
ncbi:MAG: hypothetical protein AB1440_14815 [Pseudomonadota bacterium]